MFRFTDLVILELTRDCNLQCEYCLMLDKYKHKQELLDFELYKKIIDQIIKQRLLNRKTENPLTLIFHGGEPLLANPKNFYKYAEYAYENFRKNKLKFFLGTQTNGLLLNDEFMKILLKFDFSVGVSFDGFGEANALRIKNTQASDEYYLKLFEKLGQSEISTGVITVVSKQNIDSLAEFENTLQDLGDKAGTKISRTYLPVDEPLPNMNLDIYPELFDKVYKRQVDNFIEGKDVDVKFLKRIKMTILDVIAYHKRVYSGGCGGKICGAATGMMAVRPDGMMGYCDRFTREFSFNDINHALTFDFLAMRQLRHAVDFAYHKHQAILKLHCDSCRADYSCDYGCMSFTYSTTGELKMQEDQICRTSLAIFDYIKDNIVPIISAMIDRKEVLHIMDEFYDFRTDALDFLKKHNLEARLLNKFEIEFKRSK